MPGKLTENSLINGKRVSNELLQRLAKVKVIMLDVDNTLLDFNLCSIKAAKAAAAEYGFELDDTFSGYFKTINDGLWRDMEKKIITQEELYRIRFARIFEAMECEEGLKAGPWNVETAFRRNLKYQVEPVQGAMELLQYLYGKYVLCVGSNGPLLQQQMRLRSAGMMPYIGESKVFISEDLGINKPEKGFFDRCLERLNQEMSVTIDQMLMIGDSLTADIGGAKDYGLTTIWYNHDQDDLNKKGSEKADLTVNSLSEIMKIL